MKIEFDINEKYQEDKIIICTNKITDELQEFVNKLNNEKNNKIYGYKNDKIFILEENKIETIYSENKKVFIRYENGNIYETKKRIYELENNLPNKFVRISNSAIININHVKCFNTSIVGKIKVKFKDGTEEDVSKRRTTEIMRFLKERRM